MATEERRRKKRLALRGFLTCSSQFAFQGKSYNNFDVISLSASGMFLVQQSPAPFHVQEGQKIAQIALSLAPFQEDRFEAKVRRLMVPDSPENGLCGMGVEFVNLSEDLSDKLDEFVHIQTQFLELGT